MWPLIGAAVASGVLKGIGERSAAKKHNKFMNQLWSPQNIGGYARYMNPALFGAMGQGYQENMNRIVNDPGYVDPRLVNKSLGQVDLGSNQAYQRLMGQVGRGGPGMAGGLAQAHMLAKLGMRGLGRADVWNKFALWKEGQRRQDLDWTNKLQSDAWQRAMQMASGRSGAGYQAPMPWSSLAGNAIQSGLATYGSGGFGGNTNNATSGGALPSTYDPGAAWYDNRPYPSR